MPTSRSSSRSSSATISSEPLRTLRNLYTQAARAFLNRSPSVTTYIEQAFALLPHPDEHDSVRESGPLEQQRIKWDVLRLTWEASVYPSNGAMDHQTDMNLLTLPPAVLLPALHARSLVLFTPSNLKASSSHLPAEVLLALMLFAVKLGMYGVARDWAETWWVARGAADPDGEDEIKGRRKIREAMVLRVLPGLADWESAGGWAEGEPDVSLQEVCHHPDPYMRRCSFDAAATSFIA
ncbi:hypothetical protein CALVIDRAFT_491251 [Calocera viscosa TUFC12733]|uniref:Uncharacterized protein n=1 Tax=Calocera viscosa (strain TUFC12733) TaxID=1330018 RepID=A0A167FVD7_CALVF|nr:hypothetical protein CALVIDRAFT_491251 [Calocera viscosa TUFC12733]